MKHFCKMTLSKSNGRPKTLPVEVTINLKLHSEKLTFEDYVEHESVAFSVKSDRGISASFSISLLIRLRKKCRAKQKKRKHQAKVRK